MRLTREFTHEAHQQQVQFSIRGRSVNRNFGGDAIIEYGRIAIDDKSVFPQPAWMLTPESHDTTRQLDLGVTMEERWSGVGSFALGVLHDHYRGRPRTSILRWLRAGTRGLSPGARVSGKPE